VHQPAGDDFNGSIGLPISSTIITSATTECVPQGQSPDRVEAAVMPLLLGTSDATEKIMLPGQVCARADIGYMDARGFVYIEDRKERHDLVSGFKCIRTKWKASRDASGRAGGGRGGAADERAAKCRAVRRAQDPSLTKKR